MNGGVLPLHTASQPPFEEREQCNDVSMVTGWAGHRLALGRGFGEEPVIGRVGSLVACDQVQQGGTPGRVSGQTALQGRSQRGRFLDFLAVTTTGLHDAFVGW
jgi:hypothetical protein